METNEPPRISELNNFLLSLPLNCQRLQVIRSEQWIQRRLFHWSLQNTTERSYKESHKILVLKNHITIKFTPKYFHKNQRWPSNESSFGWYTSNPDLLYTWKVKFISTFGSQIFWKYCPWLLPPMKFRYTLKLKFKILTTGNRMQSVSIKYLGDGGFANRHRPHSKRWCDENHHINWYIVHCKR